MRLLIDIGFVGVYAISALTAVCGACTATFYLMDSDYQNFMNSTFSTYTMGLIFAIVLTIIVTIMMILDVFISSPKLIIGITAFLTILSTFFSIFSGVKIRSSFGRYYEIIYYKQNETRFDIDFIQNKICPGIEFDDQLCLNNRLEYVWRRTEENGIIILCSTFVFLFVQTGTISQTIKSRKKMEESSKSTALNAFESDEPESLKQQLIINEEN